MTHFRPGRVAALASFVLLALSGPASGRVISYAPLTGRPATPAVQKRTNRHALLIEQTGGVFLAGGPSCCYGSALGRLVLHDSSGLEEPRDVTPGGLDAGIDFAAAREDPGHPPVLLAHTAASLSAGENPNGQFRFLFSSDGGATWSVLALPAAGAYVPLSVDIGGPFVRARGSAIRVGTAETPFLLALYEQNTQQIGLPNAIGLWDVSANGGVRRRTFFSADSTIIGMDAEGRRALVTGTPVSPPGPNGGPPATPGLYAVNADGTAQALSELPANTSFSEGWITPNGRAYVEVDTYGASGARHAVLLAGNGGRLEIASALNPNPTDLFAVPTADFSGAWILQRGTGPTVLALHTPAAGLVEAWRDVARPEVEALYAGASGKRLLVQVHRPRPQVDQRVFRDPALAVWEVGKPAPASYDELFLNEQTMKAFVHVDPDTVGQGEPFLFDSGSPSLGILVPAGGPSGASGGADVIQEWGVVRGSLVQRLVIPANARVDGANGSRWRTDLVLRNPDALPVAVTVRFLPNPGTASAVPDASVSLPGNAVVTESDVLASLFQVESGSGALLLTPEIGRSIEATSRTFTSTPAGSYGMSVGAVDVFAGIGAGFPVSFAAGLLGPGFRTNVLATDVSGRGAQAALTLSADTADPTAGAGLLAAPAWGQVQVNDLAAALGAPFWRTGSLLVSPQSGETVVGAIAIDGTTNDPTYFPPDIPATVVRTIPAIVHADGAHGAAFRSDLFLFNPADGVRTVRLLVKSWSANEPEQTLLLTLLPHESKTIRDALLTAFGRTGVARLRFQTDTFADVSGGVRVTSRTYTAGPSGGTYGLLLPALNSFQSAGGGEALEILLPAGGSGFRTNLALVELTTSFVSGPPVAVRVEVFDEHGLLRDRFETPLPLAGGVQIDDLFHGRGLGDGPPSGHIRISPAGGLVAAYASVIDNGTNDPMYAAAQLAAKD
jgi:hypothetical protein